MIDLSQLTEDQINELELQIQKHIDEILEYSKSEYGKDDYLHQSSHQLNDNERKIIIDLVLK